MIENNKTTNKLKIIKEKSIQLQENNTTTNEYMVLGEKPLQLRENNKTTDKYKMLGDNSPKLIDSTEEKYKHRIIENDKLRVKPPTTLNIRLHHVREELGLSQREVARRLGLNDNKLISWYENTGSMPPYERLCQLSQIYHTSLDYLFGLNESNSSFENIVRYIPLTYRAIKILQTLATSTNNDDKAKIRAINKLIETPELLTSITVILNFDK